MNALAKLISEHRAMHEEIAQAVADLNARGASITVPDGSALRFIEECERELEALTNGRGDNAMQSRDEIANTSESTIGSDGASLGQSPGGELPVERRATSGPVVPLEERGRVDEPFEPWARRQIEKLAAILLPLESSMSKMRERVYEIVREEMRLVRSGEDPHGASAKNTGEDAAQQTPSSENATRQSSPASPSPDEVEALARDLQRAWETATASPSGDSIDQVANRGYLAEARYVLSRYEPRGARASAAERWERWTLCRHDIFKRECALCAAPTHVPEAQPLTGGEGVPAWVPSVEEIQQFIDDGREGDLRALIASRAPAAPVRLMRMHCPYCHWAGELRRNIAESDVDAIAHAETCSVHPRRALERRIAELESAPAAPVVDVERVVADAHHAFVTEASFPHIAQAIRAALHAQNVRTVTP